MRDHQLDLRNQFPDPLRQRVQVLDPRADIEYLAATELLDQFINEWLRARR